MKLKTNIDQTDKKDLDVIIAFADFMFLFLGPKSSAHDLADEAENIIVDEFCDNCEQHYDGCECPKDHHREWEPDYDDWEPSEVNTEVLK